MNSKGRGILPAISQSSTNGCAVHEQLNIQRTSSTFDCVPHDFAIAPFNSFNPFILRGDYPQGYNLTYDSLMSRALDEPDSVYGLSRRLFPHRPGALDSILAIGETMAHLAYLLKQRRVQRTLTAEDSYEYRVRGA